MMRLLLDKGAAVNLADGQGCTALYRASQEGVIPIVRLLLERGAAVDTQTPNGTTPLFIACQNGHVEVAHLLLDCKMCNAVGECQN